MLASSLNVNPINVIIERGSVKITIKNLTITETEVINKIKDVPVITGKTVSDVYVKPFPILLVGGGVLLLIIIAVVLMLILKKRKN